MKTNAEGIDLIKRFEGFRSEAYLCPALVWTIGYGHTGGVSSGMKITRDEAEALLRHDLIRFEDGVRKLLGSHPATEDQFSAMVSFAYNVGLGAAKSSSVLARHKEGQYQLAADAFLLWNKASGKVLDGLTARRRKERALYLRGSAT